MPNALRHDAPGNVKLTNDIVLAETGDRRWWRWFNHPHQNRPCRIPVFTRDGNRWRECKKGQQEKIKNKNLKIAWQSSNATMERRLWLPHKDDSLINNIAVCVAFLAQHIGQSISRHVLGYISLFFCLNPVLSRTDAARKEPTAHAQRFVSILLSCVKVVFFIWEDQPRILNGFNVWKLVIYVLSCTKDEQFVVVSHDSQAHGPEETNLFRCLLLH